jgi:hypothetical protein
MLQMKQMEGKKRIMYRRGKFGFSLYPQVIYQRHPLVLLLYDRPSEEDKNESQDTEAKMKTSKII